MRFLKLVPILAGVVFLTAAAPLPPDTVPGEFPAPDFSKIAAGILTRLGSSDQAVNGRAYDDCTMTAPATGKLLIDAAAKPGLDPATKTRLDAALAFRKPLCDAKEEGFRTEAAHFTSTRTLLLKAYNTGGFTDPRWNDDARSGIGYFVETNFEVEYCFVVRDWIRAGYYINRAIDAGCKDPAVLVVSVFVGEHMLKLTPDQSFERIMQADNSDQKSATTPYVKTLIDGRYIRRHAADRSQAAQIDGRLQDMVEQLKKMEPDPDVDPGMAKDVADNIDNSVAKLPVDPIVWFNRYEPGLEKAYPKSAEVMNHRGVFYEQYSWRARGHGAASTVTPAMAALFKERLLLARTALERAWELNPHFDVTAETMMNVTLGLGGTHDEMEKWFQRGIEVNPEDASMYSRKMEYLSPRWYGSTAETVAFGRECLATELYRTKIPLMLAFAQIQLGRDSGDEGAYTARPEVWQDIQNTYEVVLRSRPEEVGLHMEYARAACHASHWDIAAGQFKIIDSLPPTKFPPETVREFDALRKQCAEQTKQKP